MIVPSLKESTAITQKGSIVPVYESMSADTETKVCRIEGVQFHPESIMTEHGKLILKNFLKRSV